jgi:uncharacterized RDD family membrane protein YckC
MSQNQYAPPKAHVEDLSPSSENLNYVGFWLRVAASIIDTVLVLVCTIPLLVAIYGFAYFDQTDGAVVRGPAEVLISWVAPVVAVIAFWVLKQATPGKMVVGARVVNAKTGGSLSTGRAIARYLAYFVSVLPLGLGILWVAFDSRKQGWHDKIAGTLVVSSR